MANLETTAEINKLLKEQNKLLEVQAKIMKTQATTMKAMVASMKNLPVEEVNRSFKEMNDAIKGADEALKEFEGDQQQAFQGVTEGAEEASSGVEGLTDKIIDAGKKVAVIATLSQAFTGLNAGVRAGVGIFGSMLSVAGTLTKSFFDLTTAIIAIPFKALSALMEEAASFSGTEFRQAIEDLRKEMGDLSTNEGQAVMQTFRNMRKEGTQTGLGLYRVFGNMAERLKEMTRIAMAMGRQFTNMTDEFMSHGRQIGEYVKGLGLSEDGIKAVTQRAAASGQEFIEVGRQITTMAYQMGDAFGINGKLISKDISTMAGDFENFGSIGIKQMSQIAVFTRKLGIEIKDLLGLIGQFDDFEQAAQSAAQLSQAFGIQVDTLQLLKEQDPAARFETMRKAFLATGRSVEDLTRQELKLLSSQTGISAEALKVGFSQKKAGLSYEEIQKQADKTEKKQLSQAEAMEKLSMSIELLVKQGQQMKGGFFDIFFQGFGLGIRRSKEFWTLMRQLHRAMRATFITGRMVGRMFVHEFPGVNDVLTGLADLFKGIGGFRRTKKGFVAFGFLSDVIEDFKKFFKIMTTDPKVALKSLFDNLSKDFYDKFNSSKPAGMKIISGIKTFFVTMGKVFSFGIEMAMKGLTEGLKFLTDLIKDPSGLITGAKTAQSGFVKFFIEIFEPAWEAIKEQWPALKEALVSLWDTAWEKFGPTIMKFKDKAIAFIKKAAWSAALSRLVVSLTMLGLAKAGEVIISKGAPVLGAALGKMFGKAPTIGDFKKQSQSFSKAITGAGTMGEALGKTGSGFGKINFKAMGKNLLIGLAAVTAVSVAMAGSFLLINKIIGDVKEEQATKILKIMGAMGALYLESALVILGSLAVGAVLSIPASVPLILLGIAGIATVATGMVSHVLAIIKSIDKMSLSAGLEKKVSIFTKVVGSMTALAQVLSTMMEQATPAFSSIRALFTGENPMIKGLEAIRSVMNEIGTQVKGILNVINTMIKGMSLQDIKAGEAVTGVLSAVGNLAKALIPPPELTGSFFEKLIEIDTLGAVSSYMLRTTDVLKQLIPIVVNMMKEIGKIPAGALNLETINVFSSFLGSISSLLTALTPPPGLLDSLKTSVKSSVLWGLFESETKKVGDPAQTMRPVITFMKKMLENLTGPGGALESIQEFMTGFVRKVISLGDPKQLDSAVNLFNSVISAISTLSDVFSPEKMKVFKQAGADSSVGMLLSSFNMNVMLPLAADLPKLLSTFEMLGKDITQVKGAFIGKVASGVKDMVSEINSITKDLNSLNVPTIKTQLRQTADKLGLKGTEELKIQLNDINLTIEVGVVLDADEFEKALINRPGKSKFVIKGGV